MAGTRSWVVVSVRSPLSRIRQENFAPSSTSRDTSVIVSFLTEPDMDVLYLGPGRNLTPLRYQFTRARSSEVEHSSVMLSCSATVTVSERRVVNTTAVQGIMR